MASIKDQLAFNATFNRKLLQAIFAGVIHDNVIWYDIEEHSRSCLMLKHSGNAIAAPSSSIIYHYMQTPSSSSNILRQKLFFSKLQTKLFSKNPNQIEAGLRVIQQAKQIELVLPTLCEFITDLLKAALIRPDARKMRLALHMAKALLSTKKPRMDLVPLLACVSRCCFAQELVKPGELFFGESTLLVRILASNCLHSFVKNYDNEEIKFNRMLTETIFAGIKAGNARLGTLFGWLMHLRRDEVVFEHFEDIMQLLPKIKKCAQQSSDEAGVELEVDKALTTLENTLKIIQVEKNKMRN